MRDFALAIALMLAIEGLSFAAFPEWMQRAMRESSELPANFLRMAGLVMAMLGVALLWLLKRSLS